MAEKSPADVLEIPAGVYRGVVEGIESGHCTARIEVRRGPGDCQIVDYEAVSDEHGLQHIEHGLLSEAALHLAFGEASGITVFAGRGGGVFEAVDGPPMQIHITHEEGVLSWAWHWGTSSDDLVERSRATCRRVDY